MHLMLQSQLNELAGNWKLNVVIIDMTLVFESSKYQESKEFRYSMGFQIVKIEQNGDGNKS